MMAHLQSHTCKMGIMIFLVLTYFIVELVVGQMLKSITLVADSFHMLSDLIALIIGIAARRISKWPKSSKNTFGWQRAEVVGTLLNTVMLTTLTFTILIETIERFIEPKVIDRPILLFGVGSGGLLINILGLIILGCDHGHSHGAGAIVEVLNQNEIEADGDAQVMVVARGHGHSHGHAKKRSGGAGHMNMKAVFLHVLADFFGSVAVVVSALIIWLVKDQGIWRGYVDPAISLFMVILILCSTTPLLKKSALILLQSVPKDISIADLKSRMEMIEGIEKVHDLHVWLLQSDVIIGTVHIRCANENYVKVSKEAKKLFHDFNIHCTTIQAEFDEHAEDSYSNRSVEGAEDCVLFCDDKSAVTGANECKAKLSCCPTRNSSSAALIANNNNNGNNGNSINHNSRMDTEGGASVTFTVQQPLLDQSQSLPPHKNSSTIQLTGITEKQ